MNEKKIPSDDPKLTAYALGELEADERAAVEAFLKTDPAARAAVDQIRAFSRQLEGALEHEPMVSVSVASAQKVRVAPVNKKVTRFPYYWITGLAAACFAAMVIFRENTPRALEPKEIKRIYEVDLRSETEPKKTGDETSAEALPSFASGEFPVNENPPTGAKKVEGSASDAYPRYQDNGFLSVKGNPLSTFALDVETASYTNVRRFLEKGHLPPRDAVHIEELVNYFPYRYADPAGAVESIKPTRVGLAAANGDSPALAASLEIAAAPWNPAHRLVRIGLKGRDVSEAARPVANLVFLVDLSSSMASPSKLALVKESLRLLLEKLKPTDRLAIVTAGGTSSLALPSTVAANKKEILGAVEELRAEDAPKGGLDVQLAYEVAKTNFIPDGINRVILCTDGDFNPGATNEGELGRLVEEKAKSGVYLTVLGFGLDHDKDATLEKLADRGKGNYGYIDSQAEARKLLVDQLSGTLVTVAQDVKLQVEFNPAKASAYRLIGYEDRGPKKEDLPNDKTDAGEMGAGNTVTALYEVIPVGADLPTDADVEPLKYQPLEKTADAAELEKRPSSAEMLTVKVRFKPPTVEISRKVEFSIVDTGAVFAAASEDFKFAAAVAGFGMILRESPHKGTATYDKVVAWAETGQGEDAAGYRHQFIELVKKAKSVSAE